MPPLRRYGKRTAPKEYLTPFHPWDNIENPELDPDHRRLFGRVRKFIECIQRTPQGRSRPEFEVSILGQGSYNLCLAIDFENEPHANFVLRIPKPGYGEGPRLTLDVAILRYLGTIENRLSNIIMPEPIWFSGFTTRFLDSPCILTSRVPGYDLQRLYTCLSREQKLQMATALGAVYRQLLDVRHVCASRLAPDIGHTTRPNVEDVEVVAVPYGFIADHYLMSHGFDDSLSACEGRNRDCLKDKWTRPEAETLKNFVRHLCDIRILQCKIRNSRETRDQLATLRRCSMIIEDMSAMGLLEEDLFSLVHGDLWPRNIMGEINEAGRATITGVIDWDNAHFAPSIMACQPPHWLWSSSYWETGWSEHEQLIHERDMRRGGFAIKQAFDAAAGHTYWRLAYTPGYSYVRRILDILAFDWIDEEQHHDAVELESHFRRAYPHLRDSGGRARTPASHVSEASSTTAHDRTEVALPPATQDLWLLADRSFNYTA